MKEARWKNGEEQRTGVIKDGGAARRWPNERGGSGRLYDEQRVERTAPPGTGRGAAVTRGRPMKAGQVLSRISPRPRVRRCVRPRHRGTQGSTWPRHCAVCSAWVCCAEPTSDGGSGAAEQAIFLLYLPTVRQTG